MEAQALQTSFEVGTNNLEVWKCRFPFEKPFRISSWDMCTCDYFAFWSLDI